MSDNHNQLAMFGGQPVRTRPFPTTPVVDEKEILAVMDVFRANEFSRYAGGPTLDVEELLRLKSADAVTWSLPYWNFLGGAKVRQFEADFAQCFGVDYAIAINSATTGIAAALAAARVGPGDEVIVTCMSFTATASAILMFGSIPVFVDVDPRTFCIDPEAIKKALTSRTRAIVVVHLLGNAADMEPIMALAREHQLVVVEDCAQAPLTRHRERFVGTIGDLGVFSFQETKNMMTGEGGMIITNNQEYSRKCRLIRNHGEVVADDSYPRSDLIVGFNFRMTELTAAVGIEQLKKLEESNAVRNSNAKYLREHLGKLQGLTMPHIPPEVEYQAHVFGVLYDARVTGVDRAILVKAIRDEGIPIGTGYVRLLYENPIFLKKSAFGETGYPFSGGFYDGTVDYRRGLCPTAEDLIHNRFLWIYQINRPATIADMNDIVDAFEKVWNNMDALRSLRPEDVVLEYNR